MGKIAIKNHFFFRLEIAFSLATGLFFILIGREEFWKLFFRKEFYLDLFFVASIVFILFSMISRIDLFLGRKYTWDQYFWKRLFFQILYGVFGVLFVSFLLVFLYMEFILVQNIGKTTYFYYELPISFLVIVLVNLILIILFLVSSKPSKEIEIVNSKIINAQRGKTNVLVEPESISYIEKEADICFIFLSNGERLTYNGSLDELTQLLQYEHFFRSNRQTIIHRNNCKSYETERSGRVILEIKLPEKKSVSISQKKAREFKKWLNGSL